MLIIHAPNQGAYALAMSILKDAGLPVRYLINPRSTRERANQRRLRVFDMGGADHWILLPDVYALGAWQANAWEYGLYKRLKDQRGLHVCHPRGQDQGDGGSFVPAAPCPTPTPAGVLG